MFTFSETDFCFLLPRSQQFRSIEKINDSLKEEIFIWHLDFLCIRWSWIRMSQSRPSARGIKRHTLCREGSIGSGMRHRRWFKKPC